jgi:hypothetical protein
MYAVSYENDQVYSTDKTFCNKKTPPCPLKYLKDIAKTVFLKGFPWNQ